MCDKKFLFIATTSACNTNHQQEVTNSESINVQKMNEIKYSTESKSSSSVQSGTKENLNILSIHVCYGDKGK